MANEVIQDFRYFRISDFEGTTMIGMVNNNCGTTRTVESRNEELENQLYQFVMDNL